MDKKKILLFGASGMIGHMAYAYLKSTDKYTITPVVFKNKINPEDVVVDVSEKQRVVDLIQTEKPDLIVNCSGVIIGGSKKYPDNAILLNAYLPHLLMRIADDMGCKLIHISTDCVFSGKKGAYGEDDIKDADDLYGRSKGLGEIVSDRHLTLRTSTIGPEIKKDGEGLFHWFMQQSGSINGFTQAYWSGITTLELAKAIDKGISNNLTGLLHVNNGEKISKYDLVNLFKTIWNKNNLEIVRYESKVVDKSLLKSTKFDFGIPGYKQMLLDQKEWMDDHKYLYNQMY